MKIFFLILGTLFIIFLALLFKYLRLIMNVFLNIPLKAMPENWPLPPGGEEVSFFSLKGHPLKGVFFKGRAAATIIFCHEFGADKSFCAPYSQFLLENGYSVFTFDFRGHGQSLCQNGYLPRPWTTTNEIDDFLGAVRYLLNRPDPNNPPPPLGAIGMSRGAVTAIIAAPLAPEIKAIVSDSAFSTVQTMVTYMQKWVAIFSRTPFIYRRLTYRSYLTLGLMSIKMAEIRYKLRFPSLEKALLASPRPIFFIHGRQDSFIDFQQAQFLSEQSAGPKELWLVEGARHNEAVKVAPEEYSRRVTAFFKKYVK